MANPNIAQAVRIALIAAASASAGAYTAQVSAQDAELEQIVVTGSRIQRQDFESASPVVTVNEEAFERLGIVNAEQMVNTLPQVVPSFSSGNNNPGGGQAYIDLRGLGPERNLVLVDGKRLTPGNSSGIVDINTIPTGLVERVEVVSGGASAVYGSDAVAGAVNFILKHNFNGVEIGGQYGTSEKGDASHESVEITMGSDFADGRGNAVLFASYDDRSALTKGDREFSRQASSTTSYFPMGSYVPVGTNAPTQAAVNALFGPGGYNDLGLGVSRTGTFGFNQDGTLFSASTDGTTNVQNFRGDPNDLYVAQNYFPGRYSYNFEPWNKLVIPQERVSVGALGNFVINEHAEVYSRMLFTNYSSSTALAPSPAPTGTNSVDPAAGPYFTIPVSNPFVQANPGMMALLNSRTGDSAALQGSGATEDFLYRRRFVENGPRVEGYERNSYQILGGVKGEIAGSWKYDVYAAHGKFDSIETQDGNVAVSKVESLLDAPDGGVSICAGGFNPFGQNRLSAECAAYVGVIAKNSVTLEQNLAEAVVSGDLFSLPAGAVSMAIGAFWQDQSYKFLADSVLASGDVAGFNAQDNIIGEVRNSDAFTEIYVPIVKDVTLVKNLGATLGWRYSDHSAAGGNNSYKAELDWALVDSFRVRGSYQRAVRAPNIGELYSPQFEDNPSVTDPCNVDSAVRTGSEAAAARQLCLDQGIASTVVDSYMQVNDQIDALAGGNPKLHEEQADTYTAGIVWQPEFAERLSVSVDYYNIEVNDVINSISPLTVVNRCFNQDGANPTFSNSNYYCSLFTRDAVGGIQDLQETSLNLSTLRTDGVDFQLDYAFGIGGYGELALNVVGNYLLSFESKTLPEDPYLDYAGTIGDSPGESFPDYKLTGTLTWNIADFSTSLQVRYLPSMDHESSVDFGTTNPDDCGCTGTDSVTYMDLAFSWQAWENVTLRAGVENLTDEDPQLFTPDVDSGTDPSTYDVIGRRYFVGAKVKF